MAKGLPYWLRNIARLRIRRVLTDTCVAFLALFASASLMERVTGEPLYDDISALGMSLSTSVLLHVIIFSTYRLELRGNLLLCTYFFVGTRSIDLEHPVSITDHGWSIWRETHVSQRSGSGGLASIAFSNYATHPFHEELIEKLHRANHGIASKTPG